MPLPRLPWRSLAWTRDELDLFRQGIEGFRCDIGSIRPNNRARRRIEQNLTEERGIVKRTKDRSLEERKQVDLFLDSITAAQLEGVRPTDFHSYHSWNHEMTLLH